MFENETSYDSFEEEMIHNLDFEKATNTIAEKEFSQIKAPRFKTWMSLDGDYQLYSKAYDKLSKRTKAYDVRSFKEQIFKYSSLYCNL
jgi:hypothetical protein